MPPQTFLFRGIDGEQFDVRMPAEEFLQQRTTDAPASDDRDGETARAERRDLAARDRADAGIVERDPQLGAAARWGG